MDTTPDFNTLRPWPTISPTDLRLVARVYDHSLQSDAPLEARQLRFDYRCGEDDVRRLVKLELLQESDGGLWPTVLGLLYLPEAHSDLLKLAKLVRLAHERYLPTEVTIPKHELTDFSGNRIRNLAQQLYVQISAKGDLPLSEWNWRHPTFRDAFLDRYGSRFDQQEFGLDAPPLTAEPLAFTFRITRLRASRFRILRDVVVEFGPLTVVVGPNGAGKSTLLDTLAFLRTSTNRSLKAAVEDEGGIDRLRTRGSEGPVRLELEFTIDHGHGPIASKYAFEFSSLGQLIVVDHETLVVGPHVILDKRRGHTRIRRPDGQIDDFLESAGELGLTKQRDTEGASLLTGIRNALGQTVLVDRDPLVLAPDGLAMAFGRGGPTWRTRQAVNLGALLSSIAKSQESLNRLSAVVTEIIPSVELVDATTATAEEPTLQIFMAAVKGPLGIDELSSGTRQILLLAALYVAPVAPQLVLLEEPEAGLHPSRQAALVDLLRSISERSMVIATTHSPVFVSRLSSTSEVRALSLTDNGPRIDTLADVIRTNRWLQAFGDTGEAFERGVREN